MVRVRVRLPLTLVLAAIAALVLLGAPVAFAQSGAPSRRVIAGGSLPLRCTSGGTIKDWFYKSGSSAGLYICTATNSWAGPVGAASGDVVGPASSTDNAIARFDLATGKLLQNSTVTIADTGAVANVQSITFTGSQDGALNWVGAVGPSWTDTDLAVTQRHDLQSLSATRTATWPDVTGTVVIGSAVATTVGAAGGASALPATPLGYLTITLPDGSTAKIPYYTP